MRHFLTDLFHGILWCCTHGIFILSTNQFNLEWRYLGTLPEIISARNFYRILHKIPHSLGQSIAPAFLYLTQAKNAIAKTVGEAYLYPTHLLSV